MEKDPSDAGHPADALQGLGSTISEAASAAGQDPAVPEAAKAAFAAAAEAFQKGLQLMAGEEQAEEQGGPIPMQQGASKAQPMTMGRPS